MYIFICLFIYKCIHLYHQSDMTQEESILSKLKVIENQNKIIMKMLGVKSDKAEKPKLDYKSQYLKNRNK